MCVTLPFLLLITSFYVQQLVSDIVQFSYVTLSSDLIPWPTASEWQCLLSLLGNPITSNSVKKGSEWQCLFFCQAVWHVISSCNPQRVSDSSPFPQGSHFIACHPMTNSLWVTLPSIPGCLILYPTVCECHWPFSYLEVSPLTGSKQYYYPFPW